MQYILLRPEGGLNDILCRIYFCLQYSAFSNRTLLIDTTFTGFREPFGNYFSSAFSNVQLIAKPNFLNGLSELTVYPLLEDSLNTYVAKYIDGKNYCCVKTSKSLQFEIDKSYNEDVLLYHGCGGGSFGLEALRFFKLDKNIRICILSALQKLPSAFEAIHLRATDLKVDYLDFLEKLKINLSSQDVYVATDSLIALDAARRILVGRNIYNFSNSLSLTDKPIHMWDAHNPQSLNRTQINSDAIMDLFLLAKSSRLFISKTVNGSLSGFSLLASNLNMAKDFTNQLIYDT